MQKYNKHKKQFEKDQQTNKPFDNLYKKSLKDNSIDEIEYEFPCKIFTKNLDEMENEPFLKIWA